MPIETERVVQAIRQAMPANAKIQVVPGACAINVGVCWKLNDDPARPNKMSKTIAICVSNEAVQDFANSSVINQASAYVRLANFLSAKRENFDPRHNVPMYESPPVEKWVISSAVLLG